QDERGEREKAIEVASKAAAQIAAQIADRNAKRQVAKKMKDKGISNNDISDFTGLTDDEIDDL
ncbi:MAG: hypothetical protein ACKOZV_10850, partial [Bacteroidota bacterium]